MNISSKYDLGDIVKELGSTNSAKASKTAGSEGIFGAILSNLAAAGITGKVAAEVAEAVESGATTPLSLPVNDLLAHLKAMQGESSTTARDSTLESNSVIAATGLLAELKELQDLRKGDFESDAGKVSQSRIERDAAAMGAQGLIAFLQARLESSRAAVQPDVVSKSQADLTQRTNEKQSNPFTSLLTNDALRITKLKDSRAVLLGPDTARKPNEGASNRIEKEFASRLNQISQSSVSKNDDSPEYWNRETARLLAEMGRGNGASEFIPDTPSASAKHIEASNSALTNASAFSAQFASINPVAGNNAATASSSDNTLSRASEMQTAIESTRSDSSVHIENSRQATATGIEASNSALTKASASSAQLASINPVAGNNAATASSSDNKLSRASEMQTAIETTRSDSSVHIGNSRQATATGIEASNSALTKASASSAQLASINPVAGNNAATASSSDNKLSRASEMQTAIETTRSDSSVHIGNSRQATATGIEASNSALTNASAFSAQLASVNPVAGNNAATASSSVHIGNSRQATATGIESPSINYAQAQRPARFDNIGLLGQTATESLEMSATNAQAIAQTKTEAGQANQQLLAQRGEQLAVSAAPVNVQLVEKAQQQRKALTSSIEAGAVASASKTKSEANTAALKQQFANVVLNEISTKPSSVITPLQTNPLSTAFAPIVNQTRQARDTSPLTQGIESEITLQELELGISQGLNAKANDTVNQRVSIANLPQGIASRINPHLARGLGSGPTKISISLFPENYGQVDVEFVYSEEAGLRVSMSSESAETTRLLQSNSGGLREALLGNSLADVSVDVNAHGQSKHEGSAANANNKASAKQVATESAIEAEPLKAKASSDNSDGLDTYV